LILAINIINQLGKCFAQIIALEICNNTTVTPPPYTVTAKLLYNFLTAFFPLNRVIAKTRKVRSRITRDSCICINITEACLNTHCNYMYCTFSLATTMTSHQLTHKSHKTASIPTAQNKHS
jgi:hypothetical protein